MPPFVCILNEDEARSFKFGISYRCSSRRHHHYSRKAAIELVKAGELVWVGKHQKAAAFRTPHRWVKVYVRNEFGEVIYCCMQLVEGVGDF
jgi:hypothetical protein